MTRLGPVSIDLRVDRLNAPTVRLDVTSVSNLTDNPSGLQWSINVTGK